MSLLLFIHLFIQQTLMAHLSALDTGLAIENNCSKQKVPALRAYLLKGEVETKPTDKKKKTQNTIKCQRVISVS